jgi:hypothetical protein
VALVEFARILCAAFAVSDADRDCLDDDFVLLPGDGANRMVTFVAYVENDCAIDLVNVTITDPVLASLGCTNFPAPFSLKAGESQTIDLCTIEVNCDSLPLTNRLMVTAEIDTSTGICATHQDGGIITVRCESEAAVQCEREPKPLICITKEVACYLPGDQCGAYGKVATGVKFGSVNPQFCYRIAVTNCGAGDLTSIRITDAHLGNITSKILAGKTRLKPGEGVAGTVIASASEDTTNTVTVSSKSALLAGRAITDQDSAVALVELANINCAEFVISDGDLDGFDDDHVLLANDGTNRMVRFVAFVENDCDVDLLNVTLNDSVLANLGCTNFPAPFNLAAGESRSFDLCFYTASCTNLPLTTRLTASAQVDNKDGQLCAFGPDGGALTVTCESPATIECTRVLIPSSAGLSVRAVGGGTQGAKLASPKVLAAKNSGHVEGPMGLSAAFDPSGSCVAGRWDHLRLMRRGMRGLFNTESFDSFMAACLPCANQTDGVVLAGQICDPADQACSRDPKKAGGNKVCFSGLGSYRVVQVKGRQTNELSAQTVLFRVDLEDRNEPRRGKSVRGERYRIRMWILSDEELARLNDPNDGLLDFRQKIACSPESAAIRDGAAGALGAEVFGVRPPDIDDGGAQDVGNHQIQPANTTCE